VSAPLVHILFSAGACVTVLVLIIMLTSVAKTISGRLHCVLAEEHRREAVVSGVGRERMRRPHV